MLDGLVQQLFRANGDNFNIKIEEYNKYKQNLSLSTLIKSPAYVFDALFRIGIDKRNKKIQFLINFLEH